ncbi:hypothetical protein Btru_000007 [Bulinus truncatus]|nr:hypothetical protein Btru_000007 [Bulinus truncatus]
MNREENTVSSAIVELKAELFRKREEFRQKKLNNTSYLHLKREKQVSKNDLWNQQNSGVLERAKRDREDAPRNDDEEDILLRSRSALEEKAKLYDKIAQSSDIPDEDGSGYYLVDFQKKVIDSLVEERDNSERRKNDKSVKPHSEASRSTEMGTSEHVENETSIYMATEAYRDKMKEKWDAEAQELLEKSQTDIHYSNVQFDEIRNHGVGFFQFSKDHEEREAELASLKKLHKQTLDEQARKDSIKNKRKAQMEERLAKVRQRRNLKETVKPATGAVSEATIKQEPVSPIAATIKQEPVSPIATIKQELVSSESSASGSKEHEDIVKKINKKAVREWDIGKIVPGMSYVESRRKERESEFAPPAFYLATKECHKRQGTSQSETIFPISNQKISNRLASSEFKPYSDSSNPVCNNNVEEHRPLPFEKSDIKKESFNQIDHGALGLPTQTFDLFTSNNLKEETSVPSSEDVNNQSYYYQYPQQYAFSNTSITVPQNVITDTGFVNESVCPINYQQQYPVWPISAPGSTTHNSTVPITDSDSQQQPKIPIIDKRFVQNEILTQRESVPSLYHQEQYPVWPFPAPGSTCKNSTVPMTDSESLQQPKKPKVAIIDTRFVKNENLASMSTGSSLEVKAVAYTPGIFTAAKQKILNKNEETHLELATRNQFSGAPVMYAKQKD